MNPTTTVISRRVGAYPRPRYEDIEVNLTLEIVKTYLSTSFEGGRHIQRLNKIKALEANF